MNEKFQPSTHHCFRGVFLDRDGVINRERGHVRSIGEFELLPGVAKAIAELNRRSVKIAVLSNQSGIARGFLTEEGLERIHNHMTELLALEDAHIDYLAYSPWLNKPGLLGGVNRFLQDHPDRKPNPGMLWNAMNHFRLSPSQVCFVGDSNRDLEAAKTAGLPFFAVISDKFTELDGYPEIRPSLNLWVENWVERGWLPSAPI